MTFSTMPACRTRSRQKSNNWISVTAPWRRQPLRLPAAYKRHRPPANYRPESPRPPKATVIRYEHPLNERIRTLMRLEDLYQRVQFFASHSAAPDHHAALLALFEIT